MTGRILLSLLLIGVIPGLNFYLHQALVPEQATDLALQQMNEDGSRETLRAIEQISNWIDIGSIFSGILGILVIWYGKIRERQHVR
jgi:uncharacterized membrane protein YhfC